MTGWSIESIGRAESEAQGTPPSEEEMEDLLPDEWPSNWVELERSSGEGHARVTMAHPNPDPGGPGAVFNPGTDSMTSKYDFVESLVVQGYPNEAVAKQNFENYKTLPTQGAGASIPGAPEGLTVGDALETFAPGELSEEVETLLEEVPDELEEHGTEFSRGRYLGRGAMLAEGEDGEVPVAVLIDNFVISASPPFASESMDPGDTPTHSVNCRQADRDHDSDCDCRFCEAHGPRSTLTEERFVHREAIENLHEKLFSSVTDGDRESTTPTSLKINGSSEKKEDAEGKGLSEGETVETGGSTRADLNDEKGNRLTLGPETTVKVAARSEVELSKGTLTAAMEEMAEKVEELKAEGYSFEVRTPQAVIGVRGTTFHVFTDRQNTSLTVVEGEVELSDLEGNTVTVRENQYSFCSSTMGLQDPVEAPLDVKEQFDEKAS